MCKTSANTWDFIISPPWWYGVNSFILGLQIHRQNLLVTCGDPATERIVEDRESLTETTGYDNFTETLPQKMLVTPPAQQRLLQHKSCRNKAYPYHTLTLDLVHIPKRPRVRCPARRTDRQRTPTWRPHYPRPSCHEAPARTWDQIRSPLWSSRRGASDRTVLPLTESAGGTQMIGLHRFSFCVSVPVGYTLYINHVPV